MRAATRCGVLVLGCGKDLDSGERHSGWLMMKVGAIQCGSMYVDDSLSRSRGRVGEGGRGMARSANSAITDDVASGPERSGSGRPRAVSRKGMKSMRLKGGENNCSSKRGRDFRRVSFRLLTCFARPDKKLSVMAMSSSSPANDL